MLKKFVFIFIVSYAFKGQQAFAQPDYITGSNNDTTIKTILVLPDKNYTLPQILTDSSLRFAKQEKISIQGLANYWAKIIIKNTSPYDEKYALRCSPSFNNVLYSFNEDSSKWLAIKGGRLVSNNTTIFTYLPVLCKGHAETVFYIKINVTAFHGPAYSLITQISVEKLSPIESGGHQSYAWWLVTIFIVLAFFIYNAYLYFMFKDRVYLYYLLALLAGIVYITGNNFYLSYFTSFKILAVTLFDNGSFHYIPTDKVAGDMAVAFVMLGLVQFARHYLQTTFNLPFWDKVLKYAIAFFVVYQIGYIVLQLARWLPIVDTYLNISNVFVLLLIAMMLFAGVIAYRKKLRQAKYYLLAQVLPLLVMIVLVVYLIIIKGNQNWGLQLLPNIAIVAQTLTFAIALVARVNLIKDDLHFKTLENQQIAGQVAIEQERNVRLEEKIEFDKRDIAAARQIKLLMKELHHRVKNNLQIVSSLLSLQSFRIKDKIAADAVREGQHRIEAMSLIHQRLYTHDNITEVNIKEYVTDLSESLMQAYGHNRNNFILTLNIENEMMDVDKAIPLSLIINELVTNAFKYAYTNIAKPVLTITLTKKQNDMQLFIADNGKGLDMEAWQNNKGYGKELVQTFVKQLDGEITVKINNGTTFTITFPNYLLQPD